LASPFLREAEDAGRITEIGLARRSLALICYFLGDFAEARSRCERALAVCNPEHYEETRRYGEYTGTVVTAFLALTNWQLGEVERARELTERANRLATELGHVPSMAAPLYIKSELEILRGDPAAALNTAEALEAISRKHGMRLQRTWAELLAGWARGRLNDPAAGAAEVQRALAALADHGQRLRLPFYSALLAELEVETLGADGALAHRRGIDPGASRPGEYLAFLHRLRGEILLKRDPADPAPAEEAFRAGIAVAKGQGARSFGLQASLALAKLYRSTGRPADAHAVLAPALEGFSPTPEMREIEEAQALLAALEETDEVKAAAAQRKRRLELQTSYSQGLLWGKGFAAEETKGALAVAAEMVGETRDFSEWFTRLQGQFRAACTGGELHSAREMALVVREQSGVA
jgi:ATP/maltotriose-dependent transcriptional regulator MalT